MRDSINSCTTFGSNNLVWKNKGFVIGLHFSGTTNNCKIQHINIVLDASNKLH
jgi:hypothetical protein